MPLYEYHCFECGSGKEDLRPIAHRNDPTPCEQCKAPMELIISAPSMHIWDSGRSFPNLSHAGDGSMSFASKTEYEMHLRENNIGEVSTDAPVYRPHGNKVVGSWK